MTLPHPLQSGNRSGFTLTELMIAVSILGLLAALTIGPFLTLQARAKEAAVRSNAHTVQMAAEDFAVQNDGVYATDGTSALPSGVTVVDLVPPGRLHNPFSAAANGVVWNGPAINPGEVGYDSTGLVGIGYTIDGMGTNNVVIVLSNDGS